MLVERAHSRAAVGVACSFACFNEGNMLIRALRQGEWCSFACSSGGFLSSTKFPEKRDIYIYIYTYICIDCIFFPPSYSNGSATYHVARRPILYLSLWDAVERARRRAPAGEAACSFACYDWGNVLIRVFSGGSGAHSRAPVVEGCSFACSYSLGYSNDS